MFLIPVSYYFKLFQDKKNATFDEKLFVLFQSFIQSEKISLFHCISNLGKLHQVVPEKFMNYMYLTNNFMLKTDGNLFSYF